MTVCTALEFSGLSDEVLGDLPDETWEALRYLAAEVTRLRELIRTANITWEEIERKMYLAEQRAEAAEAEVEMLKQECADWHEQNRRYSNRAIAAKRERNRYRNAIIQAANDLEDAGKNNRAFIAREALKEVVKRT